MERSAPTAAGLSFAKARDPHLLQRLRSSRHLWRRSDPRRTAVSGPPSASSLTAYEMGVEDVVAFLTDGISAQQLGAAHGRQEARERRVLLTRFRCEPIPRAAVRLVSPTMGHVKSGQGPVIRDVPKSSSRLAQRGGFLSVRPSHPSCRRDRYRVAAHGAGQAMVHKRLSSARGRPCSP
jgi:hypothetical protein